MYAIRSYYVCHTATNEHLFPGDKPEISKPFSPSAFFYRLDTDTFTFMTVSKDVTCRTSYNFV